MIKTLLATCLVAAVKADADAYYGGYGQGLYGAVGYAGVPFGSSSGLDPLTQGLDASTQGYAPYAGHYYGKRSADPFYGAYGAVGYAGVPFASSTGLDPITQGLDASTQGFAPYANFGYGYAGLGYGHGYGKRSADPFYGAYGAVGYAGVPFGSSTGLDALTQGLDASTQGFAPYANFGYGYAGHGYGHGYGKRSADPFYGAYGAVGYAGVPFGSSTGLDPLTQGLDASTQGYAPYANFGYGYAGSYLG